jgi:hypothetical protein
MSPPRPIIMTCQSNGVIVLRVAVVFILAKFLHLVAQKREQILYISRGKKSLKWPDLD